MPNDFLIDYNTRTLQKRNGDFVVGEATEQHQRRLTMAQQGQYRQTPLAGVGIEDFIDDEGPDNLIRTIRKQYVQDGMAIDGLQITPQGINVEAHYV